MRIMNLMGKIIPINIAVCILVSLIAQGNRAKTIIWCFTGFDKQIEYLNSGLPLVSSHFQHQSVQ